jgi:hypothetical protein
MHIVFLCDQYALAALKLLGYLVEGDGCYWLLLG